MKQVLRHDKFDKIFLIGGSAGGHIALLCANKESDIKVDGVIALYPCVNPEYMYEYYVTQNTDNTSLSARLGNIIYCSLFNGSSGSPAGETELLFEQVFSKRTDKDPLYETANVINCIDIKDIPILIVQGDTDSMIAVDSVIKFYDDMVLRNKKISYLELPGVEHVFDMKLTTA